MGERFGSGDGERKTLLTRQIAFEPLPASVLFGLVGAIVVRDECPLLVVQCDARSGGGEKCQRLIGCSTNTPLDKIGDGEKPSPPMPLSTVNVGRNVWKLSDERPQHSGIWN